MQRSAEFFIERGIGGQDEETISDVLRGIALSMSSRFGGPPDYWLGMEIDELVEWTAKAYEMTEKERQRSNTQEI